MLPKSLLRRPARPGANPGFSTQPSSPSCSSPAAAGVRRRAKPAWCRRRWAFHSPVRGSSVRGGGSLGGGAFRRQSALPGVAAASELRQGRPRAGGGGSGWRCLWLLRLCPWWFELVHTDLDRRRWRGALTAPSNGVAVVQGRTARCWMTLGGAGHRRRGSYSWPRSRPIWA
jgi:hypothetical protein